MSLYDDIDTDESGGGKAVVAGWSSNYKLMKSQLQAKKASVIQTKTVKKPSGIMAPVVDLKRTGDSSDTPLKFNMQTGRLEPVEVTPPIAIGHSPFIASDPIPSLTGVKDEYNPLRPNDYEELTKKRKEQKQKDKEEEDKKREHEEQDRNRKRKEREKEKDMGEMERARRRREDDEAEYEYERPVRRKGEVGAAIAPPTSLLEEPPVRPEDMERSNSPKVGFGSVASKIMAKYGYKEGQGLGKSEQGMSKALLVEKTSKRGGKIIHERDMPKDTPREPQVTNAQLLKNPTKVVLLRNMVGPGDVDAELEHETFEECGKYGKVVKCLIYELPDTTEDETVRIFVEFDRIDSAIKAIIDLNGRFFGGRVVKACFFNLDKFWRLDLASDLNAI